MEAVHDDARSIRTLFCERKSEALPSLIDLSQASLKDVERFHFVDWKGFGRRVAMVDRACARSTFGSQAVLPHVACDQARVSGILKDGSRCRFELRT